MEFKAYNLFLKTMRSDKSFRVEMDISLDEYDNVKDIPKMVEGVYKIVISPEIGEE